MFLSSILGYAIDGAIAALIFMVLVAAMRALIRVCPPDKVMVIQGSSTTVDGRTYGFRVINGGRALVLPYIHRAELLDLGILPIEVTVENVNSANGIKVGADATACVCVDVDDRSLLYVAVERLLSKSREEIHEQIKQTLLGNFRGAMNRTTPLEAMGMVESMKVVEQGQKPTEESLDPDEGERAKFRHNLLDDANEDLSSFGMKVVSVSFMRIWDSSGYIANLATKSVARKRQEVEIAEAQLSADAERAESDAARRIEIAKSTANQRISDAQQELGKAQAESDGRISQATRRNEALVLQSRSEIQTEVETAEKELQVLRNQTETTIESEMKLIEAQTLADGEKEAASIKESARNEMLVKRMGIIQKYGEIGQIPMFLQGQLPKIFEAYHEHAKDISFDNLTFMGDDVDGSGYKSAANRGPAGFAEFMDQMQSSFGLGFSSIIKRAQEDAAGQEAQAEEEVS